MTRRRTAAVLAVVAVAALAGCTDGDGAEEPDGQRADPETSERTLGQVVTDDLAVRSDGTEVAADCFEGMCRWNTASGAIDRIDERSLVAISPDWSRAVEIDDGTVQLVDPGTGAVERELAGLEGEIRDVAFSSDGELLAALDADGNARVWSVADASVAGEVRIPDAGAAAREVVISPDGKRLAVGGGAPIQVFDIASGDLVRALDGSGESSVALAWSPDGRWLAGAGSGPRAAVWDASTFDEVAELEVAVDQLAFAPDSATLAVTVREDRAVRLWSPPALGAKGPQLRELRGHTSEPGAVAFAPDGATLYSISEVDYVVAWDVATATRSDIDFDRPRNGG